MGTVTEKSFPSAITIVGVDFFVYTPKEFADAAKNNLFFRDEILLKGKVVHRPTA